MKWKKGNRKKKHEKTKCCPPPSSAILQHWNVHTTAVIVQSHVGQRPDYDCGEPREKSQEMGGWMLEKKGKGGMDRRREKRTRNTNRKSHKKTHFTPFLTT
mmetsp:Transcript_6052/g.14712  ORF Transcript_6052/g.14712 Transcript_6052/m.14712 type:complete len:101 (+) Transcript_6052:92-394(+)